jgi:hypothetical protein
VLSHEWILTFKVVSVETHSCLVRDLIGVRLYGLHIKSLAPHFSMMHMPTSCMCRATPSSAELRRCHSRISSKQSFDHPADGVAFEDCS